MKNYLIPFFIFSFFLLQSQNIVVVDSLNRKPIPFVNIHLSKQIDFSEMMLSSPEEELDEDLDF